MNNDKEILKLKSQFRDAILKYRGALDDNMTCGAHMQAVIRPHVGVLAQKANDLGFMLKKLDPEFPKAWTPFPTGI